MGCVGVDGGGVGDGGVGGSVGVGGDSVVVMCGGGNGAWWRWWFMMMLVVFCRTVNCVYCRYCVVSWKIDKSISNENKHDIGNAGNINVLNRC